MGSFFTIFVAELGDKTFILAAILAIRYKKLPIFVGASLALAIMNAAGAFIGYLLPGSAYTKLLAGLLFFFFGY